MISGSQVFLVKLEWAPERIWLLLQRLSSLLEVCKVIPYFILKAPRTTEHGAAKVPVRVWTNPEPKINIFKVQPGVKIIPAEYFFPVIFGRPDILRIKTVSVGVVMIRGEATGRYLAMDGKGRLYGSVSLYPILEKLLQL